MRPRPDILLTHQRRDADHRDEVTTCPGLLFIIYMGRPVNLRTRRVNNATAKYRRSSWGNPGHAHNTCAELTRLYGPGFEVRRMTASVPVKKGRVCTLYLDGHLLNGKTFGVIGTITPLVDLWLDEHRLPDYMRVVPKPSM